MSAACLVDECGRPAHPDRVICTQHSWFLERDLADAADLFRELDTTYARQAALGDSAPTRGNGAAPRALPFSDRASRASGRLRDVLSAWATALGEDDADPAAWLSAHTDHLLDRPDADLAYTDIRTVVDAAWTVVDRPADRLYAGVCRRWLPRGDTRCTAAVYGIVGEQFATCPGCGANHHLAARRAQMQGSIADRPLSGADIARLAAYFGHCDRERTRNLIKVWGARGRITPARQGPGGEPLYPFGEVLARLLESRTARGA